MYISPNIEEYNLFFSVGRPKKYKPTPAIEELLDDKTTDPDFIPEDSTVMTADPDAGKSAEGVPEEKGEGDKEAVKENAVQSLKTKGSGDRKKAINSKHHSEYLGFT